MKIHTMPRSDLHGLQRGTRDCPTTGQALSCAPFARLEYCGRAGRCLVRYDNEAGKGDHRHVGEREEPYRFKSLAGLLGDFAAEVAQLLDAGDT